MAEDAAEAHQQTPLLGADGKPHPAWFTPKRLLALFCGLTFLIYLDQGVISSNGVNLQIQVWLGAAACWAAQIFSCMRTHSWEEQFLVLSFLHPTAVAMGP